MSFLTAQAWNRKSMSHWNFCPCLHVLWGGARLQSRGVEGVTGCSGEGLHSSIWTACYYFAVAVASDGRLCLLDLSAVCLFWPRKHGIASQWVTGFFVLVCTFCGEAPGCKVVEWRAPLGAAGRGCTLVFEPLVTILLSLLHPMVACVSRP